MRHEGYGRHFAVLSKPCTLKPQLYTQKSKGDSECLVSNAVDKSRQYPALVIHVHVALDLIYHLIIVLVCGCIYM